MILYDVLRKIVNPALLRLPYKMLSPEARVMLLAIGLQESNFEHRDQVDRGRQVVGPALGFWQFELNGVRAVVTNPTTRGYAEYFCATRSTPFVPRSIWLELDDDDVLAAAMARLLLWADPRPLPKLGERDVAWEYYVRNWRPGKPNPDRWPLNYTRAHAAVAEMKFVEPT